MPTPPNSISRFSSFCTPRERRLLRRHVLWMRLLTDRATTDSAGDQIDLPEYTRTNRELLAIKPNCSYGGDPAC